MGLAEYCVVLMLALCLSGTARGGATTSTAGGRMGSAISSPRCRKGRCFEAVITQASKWSSAMVVHPRRLADE